ncbi:MAG TPA: BtpA/SgcQ family protein [Pyrinomonadaceae bacterium]|nr:BtpA/SgcQ family protein [Pyrinomonadaceae bacterium]
MITPAFFNGRPVIGVIHVGALPGTPASTLSVSELIEQARAEAAIFRAARVDAIIIENMHDVPYLRGKVGPEIVAAMALVGQAVKQESGLPVGIQILAGANLEAMAVAHTAGLDFIRVEGFVFAHIADEGWIESSAAELLRYRKQLGAENVRVWTDVKKKHSSHAITTDISLGDTAEAAEFMRSDAIVVTGSTTGRPPQLPDVQEVKAHCRLPVILGSGVDVQNIAGFYAEADAFIIGSYFKRDGHWANTVDEERVKRLMEAVSKLRN